MDLTNLENIIAGLKNFNCHDEVIKIVDDNSETIVQLQKDQLSEGIDNTGNERDDAYASLTIELKNKYGEGLGAITDHVTFYMTGTLYESLFYSISGDEFTVKSPLPTYDEMITRITDAKYGLSPEQRLYFAEEKLLPAFSEILEQKTTFKL